MKTLKRYRFIAVFVLAALLFALLLFYLLGDNMDTGRSQLDVTVVLYGNRERWTSLEQGVTAACDALGVTPPTFVVSDADDPQDQLSLLQREIENGATGLIVAASDSAYIAGGLVATGKSGVPIVLVETGTVPQSTGAAQASTSRNNGGGASSAQGGAIQADNAAIGRELAARLPEGDLLIVASNLQRESVAARYYTLVTALDEANRSYTVLGEGARTTRAEDIRGHLAGKNTVLVTLDSETTETAIDLVLEGHRNVRLYGFGSTDKIVYYLDRGIVEEICFQNEFNIGYIGMYRLAYEMSYTSENPSASVEHLFVRAENMYEPDVERLLFPIIQ